MFHHGELIVLESVFTTGLRTHKSSFVELFECSSKSSRQVSSVGDGFFLFESRRCSRMGSNPFWHWRCNDDGQSPRSFDAKEKLHVEASERDGRKATLGAVMVDGDDVWL